MKSDVRPWTRRRPPAAGAGTSRGIPVHRPAGVGFTHHSAEGHEDEEDEGGGAGHFDRYRAGGSASVRPRCGGRWESCQWVAAPGFFLREACPSRLDAASRASRRSRTRGNSRAEMRSWNEAKKDARRASAPVSRQKKHREAPSQTKTSSAHVVRSIYYATRRPPARRSSPPLLLPLAPACCRLLRACIAGVVAAASQHHNVRHLPFAFPLRPAAAIAAAQSAPGVAGQQATQPE